MTASPAPSLRLAAAMALLSLSPPSPAAPATRARDPAMQTLMKQLEARDALIRDLQQRVTQLEQRVQAPVPAASAAASQPAPSAPPEPATVHAPAPAPSPGTLVVDEAAAERALERSLTQSGALLLPPRVAELQWNASFARTEHSTPILVSVDNQAAVGSVVSRRHDLLGSVSARFGLPHDMQLELSQPYRRTSQAAVEPVSLTQSVETRQHVSGAEDFTLGLAATLHRERGPWPDVIGRVSWNTGSGDRALGERFPALRGGLTLLKRQDPLVFTGNAYVESARERNGIQPGRQVGLSLAALLAASPQTSLSVGLDQVFAQKTRVEGLKLPGSAQLSSMLTLGSTTSLGKRALVSVSLGVGLSRDAPNYTLGVAVPIRFDFLQ